MRNDERGFLHALDDVGEHVGFARAGHAHECLKFLPAQSPVRKFADYFWLIAFWAKRSFELKLHRFALSGGFFLILSDKLGIVNR